MKCLLWIPKGEKNMKLGIDIGGVIMSRAGGSGDTSFLTGTLEDAMRTPPAEGMFEVVPQLVRHFDGQVWVISKCGPRIQNRTRQWLEHHRFFDRTEISPDRLLFCLQRPEKALLCRQLDITHFIDDRLDVLEAMRSIVSFLVLFGDQPAGRATPDWCIPAKTWLDVSQALSSACMLPR